MDTKKRLLAYLSRRPSATGRELRERLDITRQALNVHLRELIASGAVVMSGSTRGARYAVSSRAPAAAALSRDVLLHGLDESVVYGEIAVALNLRALLRPNVESIAHYAFTEMLNNAIEHSRADRCRFRFRLEAGSVSFDIRDRGVGVFQSIASKLQLEDEHAALIELLKGKTTTMPESHTGEGIFFTSKVADRLVLRSHRTEVDWNQSRDDVFVSSRRFLEGTEVQFRVERQTRRRLESVFSEFAPPEYDFRFQKTTMLVKLLQPEYVSRSEAKRLLSNLEKFREIVLDFKGVKSIGQGFADEVFRVFGKRHPEITISVRNASPVIDAMLRHVGAG